MALAGGMVYEQRKDGYIKRIVVIVSSDGTYSGDLTTRNQERRDVNFRRLAPGKV